MEWWINRRLAQSTALRPTEKTEIKRADPYLEPTNHSGSADPSADGSAACRARQHRWVG